MAEGTAPLRGLFALGIEEGGAARRVTTRPAVAGIPADHPCSSSSSPCMVSGTSLAGGGALLNSRPYPPLEGSSWGWGVRGGVCTM